MIHPTIDDAIKHLVNRMQLPMCVDDETYFCGAIDMLTLFYGVPRHSIRQMYTECKTAKLIAAMSHQT